MKKTKKGFTITELVIVIAVIAILAAVLIPTFSSIVKRAEESAALQESTAAFHEHMADVVLEEKDVTGMVFVNDGYVFANLEGTLRKIGEEGVDKLVEKETLTVVDLTNGTINGEEVTVETDEKLYSYTVEIEGTTYYGYFTYNANDATNKIGNTIYSREFGASTQSLVIESASSGTENPAPDAAE